MNEAKEILGTNGTTNPMESMIWFWGIIVFYFAMQLWILPKLGIPT